MTSPAPPDGIVDLHLHLFPPRMFEAVWRFFERGDWAVHREQAPQIVETLQAHGVGCAVALSYPHKPGVARALNEFMVRMAELHPVFRPFASVHVDDDDMRAMVDEVIASEHLYGFKFQPLVQAFDVNDRRLDYLYERCLEADFPILMHAGDAPQPTPHVGFTHFARLLGRYPELRICVAHMGGSEYAPFLAMLDDHPAMVLDTTMINTATDLFDNRWRGDAEALTRHADRICFGSDWPNVPYPYQEALDSIARFPLPPEAAPAVLRDNALRFLKLA